MKKRIKIIKIVLTLLLVLTSIFIYRTMDIGSLQDYISDNPLIYIGLFIILPIFFFPVPVLALSAGLLFGIFYGSLYTIIGVMLNSALMFYISRFLGQGFRDYVRRKLSKKSIALAATEASSENLFMIFLILRLLPLVSYNFINYLSGMTKISLRSYLLATFIGILPGTFIFINMGDKLYDIRSWQFIFSLLLTLLLIVISLFVMKLYKRGLHGNHNHTDI